MHRFAACRSVFHTLVANRAVNNTFHNAGEKSGLAQARYALARFGVEFVLVPRARALRDQWDLPPVTQAP